MQHACTVTALLAGILLAATPSHADTNAQPAPLVRELEPLSVRGVNYYPQETPWSEFWAFTPESVLERDMALAADLRINAVRTFLTWDEKAEKYGLVDADGAVAPSYLDKVDRFLEIAWGRDIRAVLCFAFEYHERQPRIPAEEKWKRAMRAFAERFKDDGRVLMWDLMNEPERHAPPDAADHSDFSGNEAVTAYLAESMRWIKTVDPNHLTTVGLGWRIDLLAPLGLPDVLQYHNYAPKEQMYAQGTARVGTVVEDFRRHGGDRPLLIGEFGISTARDPEHGAGAAWAERLSHAPGTEAEQARLFEIVYEAVEEYRLAGAMAWILHTFPARETGWLTPEESMYGLYRLDLSPKPAADVTKRIFDRWATLENAGASASETHRRDAGAPRPTRRP